MRSHLRALLVLACVPIAAACDDYRFTYFGAAAPTPVAVRAAFNGPFGIWRADGRVVSITGGHGCNVGMNAGDTRPNTQWRISTNTGAIMLEQDVQNAQISAVSPFSGVMTGVDFNASASSNGTSPQSSCIFRGSTMTGKFSSDFSTFDAVEQLTWGLPGSEVQVQRHWVGTHQS